MAERGDGQDEGYENSKRRLLLQRWRRLKDERTSWDSHWREISNYLLPRNGRFFVDDRNKGGKRHNLIYDNSATRALRTLASGMLAGATSPARPWFALTTTDPELANDTAVRLWLDDSVKRMLRVFALSNTYQALHQIYEEIAAFGTAVSIVVPDYDNVIHHHVLTAGEYAIQQDEKGRVNTLFREYRMTIEQMVSKFGVQNCSERVREASRQQNRRDELVTVIHAIEQRLKRDASKADNLNMPFRSCYFELASDDDRLLQETGFETFPALAPRWNLAGGDVYGNGPGMEALGDIKQLQQEQFRKSQGIDYMAKPPFAADNSFAGIDERMLPGSINFGSVTGTGGGIRPAFEVRLDLNHLLTDIYDVRSRINGSFYADLFLMLSHAGPDSRMTATEVAERHEEKLLMLGPVLERLHNELLRPLIDITFARMLEVGALLPPPPELQGADLSVEFVSLLAQAQRAIGANSLDRFVGALGVVSGMKQEVLDNFDQDAWFKTYAGMTGVDPKVIVPDDVVAEVRSARQKMQAEQMKAEARAQEAKAAKDLAASPTGEKNALTDVMSNLQGYDNPAPQFVK